MAAPIVLTLSSRAATLTTFGVGFMGYGTLACISRLASKNKALFGENEKLKTELEGAKKWGAIYHDKTNILKTELAQSREASQKNLELWNETVEQDNAYRTFGAVLVTVSALTLAGLKYL